VPMDGGRGLEKVWIELVGYWPRESRESSRGVMEVATMVFTHFVRWPF
jgi:hypothetical protein